MRAVSATVSRADLAADIVLKLDPLFATSEVDGPVVLDEGEIIRIDRDRRGPDPRQKPVVEIMHQR